MNAPAPHDGEPATVPGAPCPPPAFGGDAGAPDASTAAAAAAAASLGVAESEGAAGSRKADFEGPVAKVAAEAKAAAAAAAGSCGGGVEGLIAEGSQKTAPARGSGVVGLDAKAEPWTGAVVKRQQQQQPQREQQQHPQPQALDEDFPSFEADPPDLESG